jgi:hypothetical protein
VGVDRDDAGSAALAEGLEVKEHLLLTLAVLAILALGCSETPVSFPLRSLERSGEVSFVCVGPNGEGYDLNACPDFENTENRRHMLALITQTFRGEVAIVDLSAGKVVDLDQSTPGYGFIPVGENPVDIVSTPGGVATFVAVAEVGQPGIYAIPSTCAKPPAHDLVTWPACALDAPPGEMAILVDPAADDGGVRASCDGDYSLDAATPGVAPAATRADCAADLALETVSPGRRKLVVTLPTLGQYVIIDAQELLDRQPGSFDACPIERRVEFMDELPASTKLVQKIPADLQTSCGVTELEYGPPEPRASIPAGIDVSDGRLFVADRGNPLVHVIDVHDPCSPIEQPPFVALSYDAPNRPDIFTTHVAVSPPTTNGSRFAYAVDGDGNTMIFDATPGYSDRTPIVRSGSPRLPFEPPDRIQFDSPARGVTFALRDVPAADPATGVASIGTYCDPDPLASGPSTLYRPNSAYSSGARAHNLRGVFGFVMLASGQVAVIDVEDFDAACRRPIEANSSSELDFRGCSGDPQTVVDGGGYVVGAEKRRTVTAELSCRMVEQHRARSGRVMINSNEFGVNAPSLRNFPRLSQENSSVGTTNSQDAQVNPKLLAVDFPDPANPPDGVLPAEVFIGVSRYRSGDLQNPLDTIPQTAERASIALLLQEPRAFFGDEDLRLVYEGEIVKGRVGRFDVLPAGGSTLVDFDGGFCDRGIEGVPRMRERGAALGVEAANLDAFAREHADYVQITSELHDKDDSYWVDFLPSSCETQGKAAFFACRDLFGAETEVFKELRDFVVLDAHQGDLVVEPRRYADEAQRQKILADFGCCFGGTKLKYSVRAGSHWVLTGNSGIQHNIIADPTADNQCIRDCNPRNQFLNGRAFEIAASGTCTPTADLPCAVGPATGTDAPSCIQTGQGQVAASSACVFQSLTHRFAVYRGTDASRRDMTFSWSVTGGFSPLTASLTSQTRAVSPQSIVFVPQIGQLAVADGAAAGLVLISLDSVAPSQLFF